MNYEKDSNQVISHYLNDCPLKKFSLEEERKLLTLAKNNDSQARETLILNNIRLVISIAKKYVTDKDVLDDLIQEGCIGIMKAIEKFDLSSPYRFSTYEVFWVKAYISRYVCQNDIIKRPIQVKYIQMQYWKLQQKNPDIELAEAAKQLQVSEKRLKNILDTCFEMELFENLTENNQEQNVINLEQAQSPEIKYLGLERRLQILNLLKKQVFLKNVFKFYCFVMELGSFLLKH